MEANKMRAVIIKKEMSSLVEIMILPKTTAYLQKVAENYVR
jgi:hypothetical protein